MIPDRKNIEHPLCHEAGGQADIRDALERRIVPVVEHCEKRREKSRPQEATRPFFSSFCGRKKIDLDFSLDLKGEKVPKDRISSKK